MYGRSDPVCPFFAFYSLGEVAETIVPDALIVCILHHATMILEINVSKRCWVAKWLCYIHYFLLLSSRLQIDKNMKCDKSSKSVKNRRSISISCNTVTVFCH